jgi:hypothetical protein
LIFDEGMSLAEVQRRVIVKSDEDESYLFDFEESIRQAQPPRARSLPLKKIDHRQCPRRPTTPRGRSLGSGFQSKFARLTAPGAIRLCTRRPCPECW